MQYRVNIFREMRLDFGIIEADSPEAAAEIARLRSTAEALSIEDCEGLDRSALVDVMNDHDFEHSIVIDFNPEGI